MLAPDMPVLNVLAGTPVTLSFTCARGGVADPAAAFSVANPALGSISAAGLFTASGTLGGRTTVTCTSGQEVVNQTLSVNLTWVQDEGVSPTDRALLLGTPTLTNPTLAVLYPYDRTVFPQGTLPPEVQVMGDPGTAYLLRITAPFVDYQGFFTTTAMRMTPAAWVALGKTVAGGEVAVDISQVVGGQATTPIGRHWRIANGTLHGNIYYTTYDSPLAQQNGAVMRVKGSSAAPDVLLGNCTVCHSVSADGTTLAAANHSGPGGVFDTTVGGPNPALVWAESEIASYAALYPRGGSVVVTQGQPGFAWPPNTPGSNFYGTATLRTRNGTIIPSSGIETFYAQTPSFSLDGAYLAFTDRLPQQVGGYWPGTLSLMTYNSITQTFADYEVLATPPLGRQFAWPAFSPGGEWVAFQDGVGEDLVTWAGNTGRLLLVDPVTKVQTPLSALNGDGYVPQGARDENKNYEPAFQPIPSGGFYWVAFTSRRTYGLELTGGEDVTKRIWVAAVDIGAPPGADPSHPAFYLPGQELTTGNSRPAWALESLPDGAACATGDQCAGGYCPAATQMCSAATPLCAVEFERCTTAADCCDPAHACVFGVCSVTTP